jgi:hypothetical protein
MSEPAPDWVRIASLEAVLSQALDLVNELHTGEHTTFDRLADLHTLAALQKLLNATLGEAPHE